MAKIVTLENNVAKDESRNISETYELTRRDFAKAGQKIILRDLNNNPTSPTFNKYTKSDIITYLTNPANYETQLRDAVIYIDGASTKFYRIIRYFASLSDLSYIVTPHNIDVNNAKKEQLIKNRIKTMNFLQSMNIKTQGREMLTVAFREDIYYATCWVENESITMQQLPSQYCKIASIEGNVCNVSFDFSYFNTNQTLLELYPKEFTTKYNAYLKDRRGLRWQDLDSPNSFAIKVNRDIKNYALPPLIGVLMSLYELEDYKALKLTKTELENYAILVMKLGLVNGEFELPYAKAKDFWSNLSKVLPEEIGTVLSPMNIEKIDFNKNGAAEADKVAEAENNIFTDAGVSTLLFNNEKASANALEQSIKADQALTFAVVKSFEDAINRMLHAQSFGKNFKITFIDSSPWNRDQMADQYLKAATYGVPTISAYCATVGLDPEDLESISFMESEMLNLHSRLKPLQSGNTMSNTSEVGDGTPGRPTEDTLSDSGETSREYE